MFNKKDLNMKKWILPAFALGSIFMAACSDGRQTTGTSEEAEGITAVKDWEVAGVSQKGPFVTGSAVTVQELDGITLKQTGKSFKGSIKSDKGDFAIKDINLQSQYAILEASGYYRDEITGKKSTGTVTLRALTDLTDRKTVNINLLTHLEYERVMYLVTEKKKPIAKAKAQADEEILAAFGIEGDFGNSEDLNIFESGDGNAALLAISVLMHADADVAGLTERMGEFSIAMAEGGDWEDADTKAVIADWACDADLKGTLANVRENIESWKYSDSVPAFEKYVTNFWWDNYGLGQCTEKREGDTKRNVNKLSKLYNEYFVCESGRWVIPGYEPRSSSSSDQDPSGTSYGVMKDTRDGQEYKTVRIGNQVWMAENLNYAIEGSRCYGDDKKNCEKYGRLYNWDIALDTISEGCGVNFDKCTLKEDFYPRQGVCPDGWHLPDAGEWDDLLEYAGNNDGVDEVGFSLQSYYWDDDWEKQYGTDKFGFNAMAAGMFDGEEYVGLDSTAVFWTSRVSNMSFIMGGSFSTLDYVMFEKKDTDITTYRSGNVEWALSVRCVKGTGNKRPESSSSVSSSSSYVNPFSSSSQPVTYDSIPRLPEEMSFLEQFFDKYKGYMEFEGSSQKDWFVTKQSAGAYYADTRDSLLAVLADTLVLRGFAYKGKVACDSVNTVDTVYEDSAYTYEKKSNGQVYRVSITKWWESNMYVGTLWYDLKIVILEDGAEEISSVDRSSLRFETELPEEVRFLDGYGSNVQHGAWNDDSLTSVWTIGHDISSMSKDVATCDSMGRPELEALADSIGQVFADNGFALVGMDTVPVYRDYRGIWGAKTADNMYYRTIYEKETEKAKYSVITYGYASFRGDAFNGWYIYVLEFEVHIYYKTKPE
jgi:uncharacterized protein (TIGR02145 family)